MNPPVERHLASLYQISKVLAVAGGAEKKLAGVFGALTAALPIAIVVLREGTSRQSQTHVCNDDGMDVDLVALAVATARVRHAEQDNAGPRDGASRGGGLRGDEVAFPLVVDGRVIGLFLVETYAALEPLDRQFLATVTDQLAVAIDRHRAWTEAQEAIRTRDHVLSIVSHDLGNALASILLTTELALEIVPIVERRTFGHMSYRSIRRSAELMNRLTRDLLDTANIDASHLSLECRATQVGPLISEVVEELRFLAERKGIALAATISSELPPVFVDRVRVQQVLHNLVGNAIKFTQKQGQIAIHASVGDEGVVCSVSDTGPGIPAVDQPRVFERFWESRGAAKQGTGLGLFIAKSLVEALGGRIWIDASVGAGATFCFTLPLVGARDEQAHPDRARAQAEGSA